MYPDLVEPIGLKKGKHLDDLDHKAIEKTSINRSSRGADRPAEMAA
jgi:hypothetical protein